MRQHKPQDAVSSVASADLAAYVTGTADAPAARRVLRAALTDPAVRESLAALTAHDESARRAATEIDDFAPADAARARSLKARMQAATIALARETTTVETPTVAAVTSESLAARVGRAIQTGRALLTLPCLAPATASAAPPVGFLANTLPLHRQTIQTGDGVRIEFQQLPGEPPYRLRVIVDASQMQPLPGGDLSGIGDGAARAYNVAYLTLEEGDAGTAVSTPARHLLIVPLNAQTRGLTDFVIGSTGPKGLAAPLSVCRLVSVTLAAESLAD